MNQMCFDDLMENVIGRCTYCKEPVYNNQGHFAFTKRKTKKGYVFSDWCHVSCHCEKMAEAFGWFNGRYNR